MGGQVEGGQAGCERRIEVFVKIPKKNIYFFFFGGGVRVGVGLRWGSGWCGQVGCERRIEVFVKISKKQKKLGGVVGGGSGGVRLGGQVEGGQAGCE